ncbi:hypothetical protein GG344DRAFT_63027 [Lentinula edodes]|nr:hypothetical protein GG344DRAFT_63027 [Lentinula edodes]
MAPDILKQPQTCSPLECYALSCLTMANHNAGSASSFKLFHTLAATFLILHPKPFGTQFYPVIAMRFNPVYLVLGLLSMVYAAPVDPGSELGSHSNFENTRPAPVVYNRNIVYIRFTGNHAARSANLKPPPPPPIIQTLVHQGLKKNFEEMTNNPHWIIRYDNEFVPLQWTSDTHDGLSLLLIYGLIYGVLYVRKRTFFQPVDCPELSLTLNATILL